MYWCFPFERNQCWLLVKRQDDPFPLPQPPPSIFFFFDISVHHCCLKTTFITLMVTKGHLSVKHDMMWHKCLNKWSVLSFSQRSQTYVKSISVKFSFRLFSTWLNQKIAISSSGNWKFQSYWISAKKVNHRHLRVRVSGYRPSKIKTGWIQSVTTVQIN